MAIPSARGGKCVLKGAVLVETVLVLGLLCAAFFPLQLSVIRQWRQKVEALQLQRLPYDGTR